MVGISGWAAEDQAKGYSIPSSITIPAGVSGEIVLYYKSVDGSALASFEFNGRTFNVTSLDGNGRAIINTGLHVTGGETFTVNSKRGGSWSLGWISPNSDRTCGSRFCVLLREEYVHLLYLQMFLQIYLGLKASVIV
jgi:hypothetical protein